MTTNRKNKKEKWNKRILPFFLIFIFHLFFLIILAYFISPLSKVEMITVKGNQDVYDQLIIDESSIEIGDLVYKSKEKFLDDEKKIVSNLTQISKSKLTLEELNQIVIEVEEFNTVAYIAKDESYRRVLENGQVLDEPYSISLGNQLILSEFEEGEPLNRMIDQLKKIEKPILNLISEIQLVKKRSNPLFIEVYMNNGNRILSKIPDFSEKIPYYPQMVEAVEGEKGVFDMEAGIYFVPFKDNKNKDAGVNEEKKEEIEDIINWKNR